ncbi:DnaB-like helicase C-terminal domain-containing protein [Halobacillus seohaensis]|uniref:DnaB-like helicase C-terminal domain-containing protein n=1 Tax=Halobacillus seohaensis TaxID=447421 RepID=A0ABW2ES78_9BACI
MYLKLKSTWVEPLIIDVIWFLHRDHHYNWSSKVEDRMEVLLIKQRNGPIGSVGLKFMKEYGKFVVV